MKDFLIRAKPERLVYPKNADGRLPQEVRSIPFRSDTGTVH